MSAKPTNCQSGFVNSAPLQRTNPRCGTGAKIHLPHSSSANRNGSTSLRELAILCWSNSVVNAAPEGISDPDWLYRDELCVHIRPYTPALILHQSKRYSRRAGSRFARPLASSLPWHGCPANARRAWCHRKPSYRAFGLQGAGARVGDLKIMCYFCSEARVDW